MSHYVGIGDDVKKELLKQRKRAATQDAGSGGSGSDSELPGGDIELPVVGSVPVLALAGVAALAGFVIWKRKKG